MIQTEIYDYIIEDIHAETACAKSENLIIIRPEKKQSSFNKASAKLLYERCHNSISTSVREAQEQIIFSERFITLEEFYYGLVESSPNRPLSESAILKEIIAKKEKYNVVELLSSFLESKLLYIPTTLSGEVDKMKNSDKFPCCDDTDIIIQNLINHYSEIINSSDKQINHFYMEI